MVYPVSIDSYSQLTNILIRESRDVNAARTIFRSIFHAFYPDKKRVRKLIVFLTRINAIHSYLFMLFSTARIKFRIAHIEVFAVQFVLYHTKPLTEALKMNNFPLAKEADRIADLRIFHQT